MTIRVAINGFGRIGRNILRAKYENSKYEDIQIVAINDLGDSNINAHLLVHDTVHGKFNTSVDELNNLVLQSSEGDMKNIVGYNNLPLVSVDFNHSSYSSVFDESLTRASDDKLYKICAWYDNEWGFSNRMLDVTMHWVN